MSDLAESQKCSPPSPRAEVTDPLAYVSQEPLDFTKARERIVTGVDNTFTRGERRYAIFFGRRPDFAEHMNEIRSEFLNQSELLFVHAALVVALRRGIDAERNFRIFQAMWLAEGDFLRAQLSLRWLISTCDTLIDHGSSSTQKALSMASVLLVNTVKLQETERHVHGLRGKEMPIVASPGGFLFDGITCFSIADGDMLTNMIRRIQSLATIDDIAGPILVEIVKRLEKHPTTFRRMADLKVAAAADPSRYAKIASRRGKNPKELP